MKWARREPLRSVEVAAPRRATMKWRYLSASWLASLSWRVAAVAGRDEAGRLYAAVDKRAVLDQLAPGDEVVFDRLETSASSGKQVQRLVVYKALHA
jgi:hypothetical protein